MEPDSNAPSILLSCMVCQGSGVNINTEKTMPSKWLGIDRARYICPNCRESFQIFIHHDGEVINGDVLPLMDLDMVPKGQKRKLLRKKLKKNIEGHDK